MAPSPIEKAIAELTRDDGGDSGHAAALRRELTTLESQLGRVIQAIVLGGNLERLVAEMQRLEARKAALVAELAAAERMSTRVSLAGEPLVAMVEDAVKDYRGLLTRQTTEARMILRELLVDRVLYTPVRRRGGRWCEFRAQCSIGRILREALYPHGGGPNGIFRPDVFPAIPFQGVASTTRAA